MPDFPEAGVRLTADIDDYRSSMNEALQLASEFDALGDISVTISAEFDAGSIESEISSAIPEDTTITVNPDVADSSELTDLESLDDNPIDAKIKTEEDPSSEQIGGKSILTTLHELGINPTQIVMNIAGTLVDGLRTLSNFSVQPLLDLDSAVARVNAQTGGAIPNAHELITGIFYDDLGDSIDQVSNLVIQAQQIGAPIDEATRAALTFTHTFHDQDPTQVLNTMNQMVITGLVPNFTEASNLLTVGFQEGDNRAGDLLTTLNNNASALNDMGLNGSQSLSLIKSGLDGGAKSAQSVVDMLVKIKTNVTSAAGNASSDVSTLLTSLGIPNPVTSGEGWSADFLTKVRDAIANAPVDDAAKQQMVSTLLGGKLGAKDYSTFMNIDAADPAFNNLKDKASTAATEMDNSLSGAIGDFTRAAQEAATNFLSSDQIDLPGKIEALKTGLQDALNTLAEGGDLGQALTIALKPIGFDDEFQSLESALGAFVIGILQAVATLQDITGHGKEAQGTRNTIAGMAQNQLAFDLKLHPEDVGSAIETGFSRGLTAPQVHSAIATAITELTQGGATGQAQTLLDSVKNSAVQFKVEDPIMRKILEGQGQATEFTLPITPDMTDEDIQALIQKTQDTFHNNGINLTADIIPTIPQDKLDALQRQIDQSKALQSGKIDTGLLPGTATTTEGASRGGAQILADTDALTAAQQHQTQSSDETTTSVNNLITSTGDLRTQIEAADIPAASLADSTADMGDAAFQANLAQSDAVSSLTSLVAQEQALEAKLASGAISLDEFNQKFAALIAIAQSGANAAAAPGSPPPATVTGHGHAGGTDDDSGTFMVGEEGRELVTSDRRLAVLNNKTTEAIMAAVSGSLGRGSVTSNGGSKVVNLTQINNVPNIATADALGYRTAQQIRG